MVQKTTPSSLYFVFSQYQEICLVRGEGRGQTNKIISYHELQTNKPIMIWIRSIRFGSALSVQDPHNPLRIRLISFGSASPKYTQIRGSTANNLNKLALNFTCKQYSTQLWRIRYGGSRYIYILLVSNLPGNPFDLSISGNCPLC